MKKFIRWLNCFTGYHEWTCAAKEGMKATNNQLLDEVNGFLDYARMYCKHCKKISRLSR